jgi:hypothetical protein
MSAREEAILTDYSRLVQNLADDYASLPVDRPEWLMKDIIQNSWDARVDKANAKGWIFTIRLLKRKTGHAVVLEDEGTTGLTGTMPSEQAIDLLMAGKDIPARERRVRFLGQAITWGRNQDAAGGRGQGKGVLLIANTFETVNFESMSEDGYFAGALQRNAKGTNLVDDSADPNEYVETHYPELSPLRSSGVRILLDNPDADLVDALIEGSIDEYILASWWPILATKARIVISVFGENRNLIAKGVYEDRIKSYQDLTELSGKVLLSGPTSDGRIIGYHVEKAAVAIRDRSEESEEGARAYLEDRAYGVHFIRQGMVIERYTIEDHLKSISYEIKPSERVNVNRGFYGFLELEGLEANREAKALENPLHYGFRNAGAGRMGKSVQEYLLNPVREGLESLDLLIDNAEAESEQERAVQSSVQSTINRLASRLGLRATTAPGTKGRNRPGGAPRMPIQIVIDNPHNGIRIERGTQVGGIQARIKNRQACGIGVEIEFTLEAPDRATSKLWEGEAQIAAGEERTIAIPEVPGALLEDAGRYSLVARVVLKSAGNLEALDIELLASKTQVKVGWYREDSTNIYISIDPPRKGLIEWAYKSETHHATMVFQDNERSPKVILYEESPVVKAAKKAGPEALQRLYLEIGLRALAEYMVNRGEPLTKIMGEENLQAAEGDGSILQATYFLLRAQVE